MKYDFLILDTPPQITKTSLPAFKVADYVILSATPEGLAVDGLADAITDINNAQRAGNRRLQLLGVLFCSFAKGRGQTRLSRKLIEYVESNLKRTDGSSFKFDTDIHRSVTIQEAQQVGQSVIEYAPESVPSEQYRDLAKEVLARIAAGSDRTLYPMKPSGEEPAHHLSVNALADDEPHAEGTGEEVASNA